MNEENNNLDEQLVKNDNWEAPPPPEKIEPEIKEQPEMSEVGTLANIFIEPGNTFKDLRKKPRFILGGLLIIIFFSIFNVVVIEKVGFRNIVADRFESSAQVQQMPQEDRKKLLDQQSSDTFKYISYAATPVVLIIMFLLGGLIYWLGANAFGGSAKFTHGLSAWIYSSFPPLFIWFLANIIVLLIKSADEIVPSQAQMGLVKLNPGFFIDGKESPALSALLSSFDVFAIWGYVLAIIGLKIIAKISTGSAAAIVLILALLGVTVKVLAALMF